MYDISLISDENTAGRAKVPLGDALATAGIAVPTDFGPHLLDLFILAEIDVLPAAANVLTLVGVIEEIEHPGFTERRLRWQQLADLFADPMAHMGQLYGWGKPGFTGNKLLTALHDFIGQMGLPTLLYPESNGQLTRLEAFAFDLAPSTTHPGALDLAVILPVRGKIDVSIPLPHPAWNAEVKFEDQLQVGTTGTIEPPLRISVDSPALPVAGQMRVTLHGEPSSPFLLFGQTGKSRLEVGAVEMDLGASFRWDPTTHQGILEPQIAGGIQAARLVIDNSQGDGFVSKLLAGLKVEAGFDLRFVWTLASGLRFEGTGGLMIQVPVHVSLGPISVTGIHLGVNFHPGEIPIELSAAFNAGLGPLQAAVDRVGVEARFGFPSGGGNLGPVQLDLGFKPPSGVGLSIDAGIVKGGGYLSFDPDKGEYSGMAELAIAEIVTVKAIGLITTKLPDGASGFSLLLILTTDFPPIQLGFGFTLNAIGGLLGVNRAAVFDVLRDGVRTGAINSILFPTDIIANAPRIISDLKAVFPPHEGTFLVGPMAKLGWGTPSLVTLSLGVILEIPPGNIAILGVLKIALPHEDAPLLQIQVNFIGTLDFDEQLLAFDASLYDSHVLFLGLEGDLVVRFKWGDNAGFLLSAGGFHPDFTPPPGLHLPAVIKRLTINILNYDWAQIRLESYFAVTSNTVQFGAHVFVFFGIDVANVSGELGFDVLFTFSPFHFLAQIGGKLAIEVFGFDLLSIDLSGSLEGPTPWRVKGTGRLKILIFTIHVDVDVTWGDSADTTLPPVAVVPILAGELGKQENWKALPPPTSNLLVTLRKLDPALLILHPFGALTVAQRAMPLGVTLDKLGTRKPSDANRVDITAAVSGAIALPLSPITESFAAAQFQEMSDHEKLSRPSYERLKGGVTVGTTSGVQTSKVTRRKITYQVSILDQAPEPPPGTQPPALRMTEAAGLFRPFLAGAAVARSSLSQQQRSQLQPFADKVVVNGESYTVATTSDNRALAADATFSSETMARQHLQAQVAANASLAGTLHVLPAHEVNAT